MRWSIIRLIWLRELRDQLRDRRTLLMIVGLPLFLYPILGFAVLQFAQGFLQQTSVVGVVVGTQPAQTFPPRVGPAGQSLIPPLAWLTATPRLDAGSILGAAALTQADKFHFDYEPLFDGVAAPNGRVRFVPLARADGDELKDAKVDLVLVASTDFYRQLEDCETLAIPRPLVRLVARDDDERSRQAVRRLGPLLEEWNERLARVRLARRGLPPRFAEPIEVREPQNLGLQGLTAETGDFIARIFPFMLVMWSLAGALYPAVDLCAGEKERGTMETLLITPAGREEIVLGKFLTIWVFSAGTALLNLLSMGLTTWRFEGLLPNGGPPIAALGWCAVLSLPQAALFSAVSLAIGAYARSSKEGQYYLMPLFVLTMPLVFLTLAPGVTLNPLYSLVPVTGVALLMQRLMTATTLEQVPWLYFIPVLAPIAIYSWLALRWAIVQFQREEVLFREAERLDLRLWFQRLFSDKPSLPTTGQAFFCFSLILLLRWFSLGLGENLPLEAHTGISELAFVAAPALFMALLLTTHPGEALALRFPSARALALSALLAVLLLPPIAALTQAVVLWLPGLLADRHPLVEILRASYAGAELSRDQFFSYTLGFALLPAICEELAFRGFLLCGLHNRFRPRSAVLLSAFLFALYHMNVFLFLPMFSLGVVLGLLTVRSRSILPAISLHFVHNFMLIASIPLVRLWHDAFAEPIRDFWPWIVGGCLGVAGLTLWWLYRKPYVDLRRTEAEQARRRDPKWHPASDRMHQR